MKWAHLSAELEGNRIQVGPMLMELDARAIQVPQLAHRALGQHREHPGEQTAVAPAPIAGINRRPRHALLGQIAPRHARAQHKGSR